MAKALFVGGLHRTIKWLCLVLVLLTYLLIYVIQHSIIKNVTVIPNGRLKQQQQQTLLSSFKTTTASEDNSALEKAEDGGGVSSQIVGSTLETWFRTNLNVTPCDSAALTIGRNKDQHQQQHEQQQQLRAAAAAKNQQQPLLQQQKRPFWQPLEPKVLLHSAFMDDRTMFQNVKYRFVRILALKQGRDVTTTFYCHLIPRTLKLQQQQPQSYPLPESAAAAAAAEAVVLTNTSTTTTSHQTTTTTVIAAVMATYHEIWVAAWHPNPPKDQFHSIMIHCPIPLDVNSSELEGVLISQNKSCDLSSSASPMLPIENGEINGAVKEEEEEKVDVKKDFCVCVKPLDFPGDPRLATRLIEWIESMILLGAQKIVIYLFSGIYIIYYQTID